jgi:hypothetical protein
MLPFKQKATGIGQQNSLQTPFSVRNSPGMYPLSITSWSLRLLAEIVSRRKNCSENWGAGSYSPSLRIVRLKHLIKKQGHF